MSATFQLELRDVRKAFAGAPAVRDFSLALAPGEFVSLLGPSGCGKSTTLSMIAGFESPDQGDILVNGKRVNDVPAGKRDVGIVFQDYAVFTRLTVRENLAFGLDAQSIKKSAQGDLIAEMAQRLDLADLLSRRGGDLNVSEQQRVALGRAAITRPRLLLLDEPMANLDSGLRGRLRGELKRIQKSLAQTILYVTHDQVEALALSDRIVVMNEGRVQQVGTPDEIYHRPRSRFVAEFIGEPPINLLPCAARREAGMAYFSTALHRELRSNHADVQAGNYLLGVRPHDVHVSRERTPGSVAGVVRFIDNLGPEHVLHIQYGDLILRALVPPQTAPPEETVHVRFDLDHALLIDPATGNAIATQAEREAVAA